MTSHATTLRARLGGEAPLLTPGVFDALSARLAARAGFEAVFVTGFGMSAAQLGEPDFGLLTQTESVATAARICAAVDLPVVVDADTGYGNAVNVVRTVRELVRVGAAGIFLEDQAWPKRCGHMRGKRVIAVEEQVAKLRAAAEARGPHDLVIVARTDARQALGLDDAIARAAAYRAAGADALFVEAPQSVEELREIGRRLPPPLVANMVEQGATPDCTADELAALGFRWIVHPVAALFAATRAMQGLYERLRADGHTRAVRDRLVGFAEFNAIVGLDEKYALDERFGGGRAVT
jgi:methylisocitrate lyase